ncbi:SpoIIIAH-like family protein [Salibacterium qingdaonense]|uniref:Stage III sporulation protein AH n=1 Tax=Salibacterium qingdaonense TaxID=266892 RepID=A0A1I4JP60_9BACI|nr:SpoIIIAH-like family protein [Salibacterium qingdaonense]SFL68320.1 stage III sporulation protein AH [Salibacterium qingdaonense]
MVLKKQTVWLMTMVSLTIVLAVYYVTSPEETARDNEQDGGQGEEEAASVMEEEGLSEWLSDEDVETAVEETEPAADETSNQEEQISEETTDNLFSEFRMERDESRSRLREEYTETIASEDYSAAEKSEAYEKREQLQEQQHRESTLENLIQAEGYEEAVVIPREEHTRIVVAAESLSETEAADLNRIAHEQLGAEDVVIGHRAAAQN